MPGIGRKVPGAFDGAAEVLHEIVAGRPIFLFELRVEGIANQVRFGSAEFAGAFGKQRGQGVREFEREGNLLDGCC